MFGFEGLVVRVPCGHELVAAAVTSLVDVEIGMSVCVMNVLVLRVLIAGSGFGLWIVAGQDALEQAIAFYCDRFSVELIFFE